MFRNHRSIRSSGLVRTLFYERQHGWKKTSTDDRTVFPLQRLLNPCSTRMDNKGSSWESRAVIEDDAGVPDGGKRSQTEMGGKNAASAATALAADIVSSDAFGVTCRAWSREQPHGTASQRVRTREHGVRPDRLSYGRSLTANRSVPRSSERSYKHSDRYRPIPAVKTIQASVASVPVPQRSR